MVLIFFAGSFLLAEIFSRFSGSFWRTSSFLYVCSFIPVAIFIFFDAKANAKTGQKGIPVNSPEFGKMNPIVFFILIALVIIAIAIVSEPVSSLIPMPDFIKDLLSKVFSGQTFADVLITTVILAPLFEEFFCRGIICRGLLSRMAPWKAIVWSALIFAVLHGNPYQGIPAFVIGCFLGWVYYRTHCIWAPVFLHGVNNLFSMLITRLNPGLPVDGTLRDLIPGNYYYLLLGVSVAVIIVGILLLHRYLSKKNTFKLSPSKIKNENNISVSY
ncbi:MAG: CPBP family intramembrane metalloprotease [Bacteroidales bacterium]|nr:CPBP family intramembrane metalloprotease [Bacteroidales bacterium]